MANAKIPSVKDSMRFFSISTPRLSADSIRTMVLSMEWIAMHDKQITARDKGRRKT